MALRKSVSVSLTPELLAFAERLRGSGRYGNLSEVIRTALRLLEERELAFEAHRDDQAQRASGSLPGSFSA